MQMSLKGVFHNKNVMVVAAHPDDEVLGCGGTIARLASFGAKVFIAVFGEGISSRYKTRDDADAKQIAGIKENAKEAAKILGASDIIFLDLPDNMFDTVPLLAVVKHCEDILRTYSPDVVFTHSAGDLNIDHQVVNRAVLTACRPGSGLTVRDVLAFEVPSSTEWSFGQTGNSFAPNVFVDITLYLEKKIRAFECYRSEIRDFPHPRSPQALKAAAARWGSVAGCKAAEAFQLIRSLR